MPKRHLWTPQEDALLRQLVEDHKMHKWVEIASNMNSQNSLRNLTGKQCRDRYVNKLSKQLTEAHWNHDQDKILIQMHREYGRRWTLIAQQLKGRGENSIKNHFYSKLRKSLRELNKVVENELFSEFKALEPSFLNKLIEISSFKLVDSSRWDEDQIEKAINIIEQLFYGVSATKTDSVEISRLRQLLEGCCMLGGTKKSSKQKDQKPSTTVPKIQQFQPSIVDFSSLSYFQQICHFMIPGIKK